MELKQAHENFRSYLKEENHRITPERFEVLDYALDYEGHFGADDLFIRMKTKQSNISRATIYNTLDLLERCNLLSKRNFGDGKIRYESNFGRKNHDHLICTNCGKIKEFSNNNIQNIVDEVCRQLGFESTGYSFNIFGKCKNQQDCENLDGKKTNS